MTIWLRGRARVLLVLTTAVVLVAFAACTGSAGTQGPPGIQGKQGPSGPSGAAGLQGSQGLQGIQGPAGQQGLQGIQGPAGVPGKPGPQGPAGPSGALLIHDSTSGAVGVVELKKAGEAIDIEGAGFQDGEQVSLFYLTSGGSIPINAGQIKVGKSGAFARLSIPVPTSLAAGETIAVHAVGSKGSEEWAPLMIVNKNPNN